MKNSRGREGPVITSGVAAKKIPLIWGSTDPEIVDRADYVLMRRDADGKGPLYFRKTDVEARQAKGWSLLEPEAVERIERNELERRLGGDYD